MSKPNSEVRQRRREKSPRFWHQAPRVLCGGLASARPIPRHAIFSPINEGGQRRRRSSRWLSCRAAQPAQLQMRSVIWQGEAPRSLKFKERGAFSRLVVAFRCRCRLPQHLQSRPHKNLSWESTVPAPFRLFGSTLLAPENSLRSPHTHGDQRQIFQPWQRPGLRCPGLPPKRCEATRATSVLTRSVSYFWCRILVSYFGCRISVSYFKSRISRRISVSYFGGVVFRIRISRRISVSYFASYFGVVFWGCRILVSYFASYFWGVVFRFRILVSCLCVGFSFFFLSYFRAKKACVINLCCYAPRKNMKTKYDVFRKKIRPMNPLPEDADVAAPTENAPPHLRS